VQLPDFASVFGRHEFLIRRLHSLSGLVPIGGYLAFHLATNAAIIDGVAAYQHRADQIHRLGPTTILVLEWSVIFLPILFHLIVGMLIVCRGKRNLAQYSYAGNIRYTLQRATGVVATLFILWHVFHMHGWFRFEWWVQMIRPLGGAQFDPAAAITAPEVIQSSWIIAVLYGIGTLACVYHLANGIWTMGITWGVWTSPRAQRIANVPCMLVGFVLAFVGMAALYGMWTADLTTSPEPGASIHAHASYEHGHEGLWEGNELIEGSKI
jgi:succinate dehydrogenase / fumarate reductase cytochrome b subunit